MEAASLLCKVRSNGEAGRPESGHAEDRLDGGPRAAEDRVPLSVVQLHEGLLHGGDTHTRLIDLAEKMNLFLYRSLIDAWCLGTGRSCASTFPCQVMAPPNQLVP